ncbi:DUF4169 family protein [Alphaproteobacteria bacterium GH1-50]|uniref:DUF4169 family protein n=1 Tax=Kangsaoukella pontilimi TaxID=2691042 RepID=A0A7C9J2N1_9RHOB|nr:DUF4169 family protein [Kangsaoukella pontilimi]MXQ07661.1 DUF4169 family protein [Kangsaoukella pontilimi]
MTEKPINLNRVRKARARDAARKEADANAVKFGRTKAERLLDAARTEQARRVLDAHRTEDDEEDA